jgi:hypothetical protein
MVKIKMLLICILSLAAFAGCTKSSSGGGTVTPIQAAGCDIETAILGGASGAISSALSCTNSAAIQASLTTALGNANLCAAPGVAAVSSGQMSAAKASMKSAAAKPMGVIGNIACPIAISTIMGFLSNSIPSAWGCSASASAAGVSAALVSVCEAAVPI